MEAKGEVEVRVTEVVVRRYALPAPDLDTHLPAVRGHVSPQPVCGQLVGVGDGRRWGWWGPVAGQAASLVSHLFEAAFPSLPTVVIPQEFSRCLRGATRHAHTGVLSVAVGALELALWDLAAKCADVPVWALLGEGNAAPTVPAYATCFGIDYCAGEFGAVVAEVAGIYWIQKWAFGLLRSAVQPSVVDVVRTLGDGRLAIDFHGQWDPNRVRETCAGFADGLAWLEEPYPPGDVHLARRGEFRAPHAAGEHCYGPADTVVLERGGVDIWQPDAGFCGGMTNFLTIVERAAAVGVRCVPHGGGLLPALHAAAAGHPVHMVENHLLLEPRRLAHLANPPAVGTAHASITVPELPGWSGELRRDLLDA